VQQILVYSRRQPQELASRPLAPLVREGVALLRATLPAGVAIDVALPAAPLYVMCDATQIQQVLMNLCTNAWHAMEGGLGRIQIGLEHLEFEDAAHRPSGLKEGSAVHLWVSDDGHGMDEATRARIFEPFFTTKALGQGTGLGLSVVHGIVTAHGGAIAVDSHPGRGSSFHVYFPGAPAAEGGEASVPAVLDATPGNGEHVLYIDDDEVMTLMVGRLLERAGFRVTAHQDAWVAVTAVHDNPEAFDIVVTDYNMPEFSGLDVARDLASLRPDLPVIISSGLVTDSLRAQAQQIGIQAVMHKENSLEELVPLVRQVLDLRARSS
ncbi:MAG: ATP-binding protein, partial [Burkholderiaceae bacterium]